jgi:hypothetical protein
MDFLDTTSCFLLQSADKGTPAVFQDGAIKSRLSPNISPWLFKNSASRSSHSGYIQIFDADYIEASRQVRRSLLHPILKAVRLASLQSCELYLHAVTARRSAPGSGKLALEAQQSSTLVGGQARYGKEFTRRQRSGYDNTTVNTHNCTIPWRGDRVWNNSEGHVPASSRIPRDAVGPGAQTDRAGPPKPDPAHLGYPKRTHVAGEPPQMVTTHIDNAESFISTGLTPCRPAIPSAKEAGHCLPEVPQRLLLHFYTPGAQPRKLGASIGELPTLHDEAGRDCPAGPPPGLLLNSKIPYVSSVSAMLSQCQFLDRRWVESVTRHANRLSKTTDNSRGASAQWHGMWPGSTARIR